MLRLTNCSIEMNLFLSFVQQTQIKQPENSLYFLSFIKNIKKKKNLN